jgi:hypothetical protein
MRIKREAAIDCNFREENSFTIERDSKRYPAGREMRK